MKKEKTYPLVSIITVNYNHSHETCEMLRSIGEITYPNYECIVVDNASPSDNIDIIPKLFPEVKFIRSKTNIGFAGGNNIGMQHASGEIFLFLNFDSIVSPSFLEPLVKELQKPGVGMVGPQICYHHEQQIIQFAGYTALHPITLRNKGIGYKEQLQRKYTSVYDTPYVHGAAMAVNASAVKEVGFMPEIYFLYYEELDWAISFQKKGYRIRYVGFSTIYHKASVSTGSDSPLKTYYMARNRLLLARRHSTWGYFPLILAYQLLFALPKNCIQFTIRRKRSLLKSYTSGIAWHVKNMFNRQVKFKYPCPLGFGSTTFPNSMLY